MGRRRSIKRDIKRGRVEETTLMEIPKSPFNNRKRTKGRAQQLVKESIYGQLTGKRL